MEGPECGQLAEKLRKVSSILMSLERVAVAYSGGVDSAFLAATASRSLGDGALAVTVVSPLITSEEIESARETARKIGIAHVIVDIGDGLLHENEAFRKNPPDRCYHCKKVMLGRLFEVASAHRIAHVVEGSNLDDLRDYRPGMKAVVELGAISPLIAAGLSKLDVRELSRELGLPTWNKPSRPCLATRIPYGSPITADKLHAIERAEAFMVELGFNCVRVRHHDAIARIEVLPEETCIVMKHAERINSALLNLGFKYVTVDLGGYRMGSMNEL